MVDGNTTYPVIRPLGSVDKKANIAQNAWY